MNHEQMRENRLALGLSTKQLAALLETDPHTVRRMEQKPETKTARKPAARMAMLMTAFLAGFRPEGWPEDAAGPEPILPAADCSTLCFASRRH